MKTPLHIKLRQYRVLQSVVVVSLLWALYMLITWMTATPFASLSEWHLAPITAALPALVAGLFKLVEIFNKRIEVDEHDRDGNKGS